MWGLALICGLESCEPLIGTEHRGYLKWPMFFLIACNAYAMYKVQPAAPRVENTTEHSHVEGTHGGS